jgi:hypothetical protein
MTPGTDQAAATASSWAAQELTVPDRITSPPENSSTESTAASSAAFRRNAALIASRALRESGVWVKVMALSISATQGTSVVRDSAWR